MTTKVDLKVIREGLPRCVLCGRVGYDPSDVRQEARALLCGVRREVPVHFGTLDRVCTECGPGYDAAWRAVSRLREALRVQGSRVEQPKRCGMPAGGRFFAAADGSILEVQ